MAPSETKRRRPTKNLDLRRPLTPKEYRRRIATQHGIGLAIAPLLITALVAQGGLDWEQAQSAVFLAWAGNIAAGCLRYYS